MSTEVIALERGHDGHVVREVGEVFSVDLDETIVVPGAKPGDAPVRVKRYANVEWFVPTEVAPPPKPYNPKARPPGAGPAKGSATKSADDLA